jgi:hypothetical protein
VCLGIGRPPKTSLVGVEPKRDEDWRWWKAKLGLLIMRKVSRIDLIDCEGFTYFIYIKGGGLNLLRVGSQVNPVVFANKSR